MGPSRLERFARMGVLAVGLAASGAAIALDFGTLFHSPEERARLDRLRRGEPEAAARPAIAAPAPTPEMTGYVRRSDGRNTLWIDGVPVATSDPKSETLLDPRKVRDDGARLPPSAIRASP